MPGDVGHRPSAQQAQPRAHHPRLVVLFVWVLVGQLLDDAFPVRADPDLLQGDQIELACLQEGDDGVVAMPTVGARVEAPAVQGGHREERRGRVEPVDWCKG